MMDRRGQGHGARGVRCSASFTCQCKGFVFRSTCEVFPSLHFGSTPFWCAMFGYPATGHSRPYCHRFGAQEERQGDNNGDLQVSAPRVYKVHSLSSSVPYQPEVRWPFCGPVVVDLTNSSRRSKFLDPSLGACSETIDRVPSELPSQQFLNTAHD